MKQIILGAALSLALAAHAQDASVTVTATRVERPSLDIPASVDRVQAEDIRAVHPQVNLSESLGLVPGIVVQNRQNYAQDLQISSRGFGTRSTFGIRGLRLIADGIPASMPDGQGQAANFDLGTAERIEILRGPFAVMHGNAAGGVINVITESGAREPGLSGELALGSFGMHREAIKWGAHDGGLDAIAGASYFATDGYREHSAARRVQTNAKLTVDLDAASTLAVVVNTFDSPEAQDPLGLTRSLMEADPRQVVANAITFNTRKSVWQSQAGVTFNHRVSSSTTFALTTYAGHRDVRQYLAIPLFVQNGATHSGGVVDLDRDYGGASLRVTNDSALAGRPLTLTLGAETEQMNERRKGFVNENGDLGALKRFEDDGVTANAAYAQAEWRFADKWLALAGLRANRVAFDSVDHYVVGINPDDSGSRTFSQTTPAFGIVYKLAPTASLYANTGRGFETPTFAELAYRPGGGTGLNFDLAASRSTHTEVGVKAAIGATGRVNAAVFRVDTRDEIVVDTSIGGRTTYKNAGRTERRGAELSAGATLPRGIEAAVAYTLLDATFRDSFASTANIAGTSTPCTVSDGNVLPGVPRTSIYGELRWRHVPAGFTATLEAQHKSRVAVNDCNVEYADAYTVANLALGLTQRAKDWRVTEYLRVDNLADKRYVGSVIVNDGNGRYYEPAPGRNVTAGVQARIDL
jgi:iron complex outermembrane receptor protein